MKFFDRILKKAEVEATAEEPPERRSRPRYALHPDFALRASLALAAVDKEEPGEWGDVTWECRVLDCSEDGLRVQIAPDVRVQAKALCHLTLTVHAFELTVPCQIVNLRYNPQGVFFGLSLLIEDETTWAAYWQLLEVIALGATLKLHRRTTQPDDSGYLIESWANSRPARLTVWRHPADRTVAAFEFRLKNYLVRASAGGKIQYLTGLAARPTTPARTEEIRRLFRWVVPNLNQSVPADVRQFLADYAA